MKVVNVHWCRQNDHLIGEPASGPWTKAWAEKVIQLGSRSELILSGPNEPGTTPKPVVVGDVEVDEGQVPLYRHQDRRGYLFH